MDAQSRILIVDDDAGVRGALRELLIFEGYQVAIATNGPEALERAADLVPDLILLDVMMPGMNGFEVCGRLRADPLLGDVPVIMLTALDDSDSRLRGIEAGADDFVSKPFEYVELQARVRTILQLNRYRRLLEERMQREQAEEALAQRVTQLALLNRIGGRLAAMLELDELLAEAVRLVQDFGYPRVNLFTMNQGGRELHLRACAGMFSARFTLGSRIGLGQGLVGRVAQHGKKLLVNDVAADPHYAGSCPDQSAECSELAVPLRVSGEVVGVLDVQSPRLNAFDENDVMVMEILADQIATSIHNAQLYEAERAARRRLRNLAGYLEDAREKERTYIAREIHDEFGQALTALKMDLAWLAKRLPADQDGLLAKVGSMSELVDTSIHMVRRIATDLRPGVLDHLGLVASIEWQAQEFAKRAGFECQLHLTDKELMLDEDLLTAVFRIFQETLTNVVRHAEATKVRVELREDADELLLIVQDNGKGMTESQITRSKSLGLIGMQERARSWGGRVIFLATPGQGTTVTVRVPMVNASEETQ
jgi:signal transduction histidine kinase